MTTVWPSASTTSRSSSSTSRPVRRSSAPVGSSAKTTSGRVTSARAIATRCCWPPESCDGRWRRRFSSPTRAATSRTVERLGRRPSRRRGRAMFWATVSDGSRLKAWKTNPMRSRRKMVRRRSLSRSRSVSPSVTVPEVGRSSPAATLRNVLLPEPEGPMIAVKDAHGSATLTPSRATTAPSPLPWTFRTSRRATAAAVATGCEVEIDMGSTLATAPSNPHAARPRRSLRALVGHGGASRTVHAAADSIRVALNPMIALAPWVGEVRAFVARPTGRRRVEALHRFTAPTRSPWFWLALWTAAGVASVVALIPVLFGGGPPMETNDVMHSLSGTSFAACGLVAWRRRRDSAVGSWLTLAGFGVLVPEVLAQLDSPLAVTLALLFGELWIMVYATLILSFATGGRLSSRLDHVIVQTFFVGLFVMQFALLLFLPDERNLLLAWPDAATAEALNQVQFVILAAAALAVAVVTAHRWHVASQPLRRALLPSLGGSLSALLYAANLITLLAGSPSTRLMTVLNAALLTVPAALLWGLLRSRLARGGLPDLFRELGTLRGPGLEVGLAAALGDPRLVLAYRVPDQDAYIDGAGQPVELPAPDSRCTAAPIECDGRELGMLVHDAALDDDPELVGAVAATAAIALDDARLQTESQERLAELRASRERLVAAGDAERRRLERDLHDGAQQRLVSVALQLQMIQRHAHTDPALVERLARSARDELSQSLQELRELARGLHPAVLNHGLKAALGSLASRATVPTTVSFAGLERLPQPVELAAYFVACEALANVGKYAQATTASIRVSRHAGAAVIEIADDGVGGAAESAGTGLQGLADRVAALDGTLRILSPPGEGTMVTAELPCGS